MTTPIQIKPMNSFLVQAYYNWLVASGTRVFIQVDGELAQPELQSYVNNGVLTLNISPKAAPVVTITEEYLSTMMTFGGRQVDVWVPIHGIEMVYDPDSGVGARLPEMAPVATAPAEKARPALSVVK